MSLMPPCKGADGVRLADANGDGRPDIATGWEQGGMLNGVDGVKHDLIALADLYDDGALDAITAEDVQNLGVVWYKNPFRGVWQ